MKNKFSIALSLAVIVSMLVTSLALADVVTSDVDFITTGNQTLIDLGDVEPGQVINSSTSFQLVCSGKKHADLGNTVFVEYFSAVVPAGFLTAGGTTIGPIPADWVDDGGDCANPAPVWNDNGNSAIVITAPADPGTYDYVVTYKVCQSNDPTKCGGIDPDDVTGSVPAVTFRLTVVSDTTPPTAAPTQSPAANTNGWNNSNVTVTWNWTDEAGGSGIDSANCTTSSTSSGEGEIKLEATCKDLAGNEGSASYTVKVDKTAPSVSLVGGPEDGESYYFGFVPAAPTCTASDATSGLDGSCSVSGYSAAVGTHTVTASATDKAGNSASVSATYTVLAWDLKGFYQPVDMDKMNTVKNGSTVPLKFEIFAGSTELTDTSFVNQPLKASQALCDGGVTDDIELLSSGATNLRYDATGGQFIYNWQTPKGKAGYCYVVTVTTADGSSISANFKLK